MASCWAVPDESPSARSFVAEAAADSGEMNCLVDGEVSIEESVALLKGMFPAVGEDILGDFLHKYSNDVAMVTNILLDSLNLDERETAGNEGDSGNGSGGDLRPVKEAEFSSLQDLCLNQINRDR